MARLNDARTAVVETHYIDLDYRSEYSAFYSRAFAHFEDTAHRVHFFQRELQEHQVTQLPEDPGYLGYMVVRPQVRGVVGRTMLKWPPALDNSVRTGVTDLVSFFGQPLAVRAVPFMQQDARLGSCAQTAAWMCHYSAHLAPRGVARRPVAAFSESADPRLAPGRLLPSSGLSLQQLSSLLHSFGLPTVFHLIKAMDDSDRPEDWLPSASMGTTIAPPESAAIRACCRYLNSGLPVIGLVTQWLQGAPSSAWHAVVACGYKRTDEDGVLLVVNDDRRGPYLTVGSLEEDQDAESGEYASWKQLLVPVPDKLWLSGDAAERHGCSLLLAAARAAAIKGIAGGRRLLECHERGDLTVRTYAVTSRRYKERFRDRARGDELAAEHISLAQFPRYVWVVEAVDRVARDRARSRHGSARNAACVLAEMVFDATSEDIDPEILAVRLPGVLAVPKPWDPSWDTECATEALPTGGQYEP